LPGGVGVVAQSGGMLGALLSALVGEAAMADRNPIDLTLANLRGTTYRETIAALVESPSYDGVVVVVGSSGLEDPSLAAAPVCEVVAATEKPVVVYVNPYAMNIVSYLNRVGVPAFKGGVRTGVPIADVEAACREMELLAQERDVELDGWLIQEQVSGGTEMLLGMIRDGQLGAAMVLGAGGTAKEVFGDSALRLLPLRVSDPPEMLTELRSRVMLEGFRGQRPADVEALLAAVQQFARLIEGMGEQLLEAEINPLLVLPRGEGVVAADGLVVFGQ